jgi:hypothetical protein
LHVDIGPVGAANLFLPHRARNRVPNDSTHWNDLSTIAFEVFDEFIKLVLGWSSVALLRIADETQMLHRKTR